MVEIVDACGLTCPAPVLLVKDAVERQAPPELVVMVDNEPSAENVTRFLQTQGYAVTSTREGATYRLQAYCGADAPAATAGAMHGREGDVAPPKILVLIASDRLGKGDEELGGKLMVNYLKTLKEMGSELWQLIFVNGGVRLTAAGSPVLAELQEYEQAGVTVLACGTCLEHFGLLAEKRVGQTTNMLDIVTATQLADKVINMS